MKTLLTKGEIIELEIEKLVYRGEGIGKYGSLTVFVDKTVPGDKIKTEIISCKSNYAKGIIKEIITPSEQRKEPLCSLTKICGGCQWQHINYEEQLKAKKQIIEESLKKFAGIETKVLDPIKNPEFQESRCKVQLPVQQADTSRRFIAGYYKKRTHEIVNIKNCPAQPEIIGEITDFLRKRALDLNLKAYSEKAKRGLIRHFVFRYSKTNKNLILAFVINADNVPENLIKLGREAKGKFHELEGVIANFNPTGTNLILGQKSSVIIGKNHITETLDGKVFRISHDSFFQVNPTVASKLFLEVQKIVAERTSSPDILDIYAGSGGFSVYLSEIANKIVAVEESESSVDDGIKNLLHNNLKNISYIKENADTAIPKLAAEGKRFDVTILDPPRKGCSEKVLQAVAEMTNDFIVYISCNPTTLARDMKFLSDKFNVEFVQPIDMFPQTYHVESILLAKSRNSVNFH